MIEYFLILITTLALIYIFTKSTNVLTKVPGPRGLPIIGNVLQLDFNRPIQQIVELAKEYPGGIMRLRLGFQEVIVVSGYKLIHEVLVDKGRDFAGRPNSYRLQVLTDNNAGISTHQCNDRWRKMKKAFIGHVKAYGSGLDQINKVVSQVTDEMIEKIKTHDQAIDVRSYIQDAVISMLCILAFKRNGRPEEIESLKYLINESINLFALGGFGEAIDMMPFLRHFTPMWKIMIKMEQARESFGNYWYNEVKEQPREVEQMITYKLMKMQQEHDDIDFSNVREVIFGDFFGAGTATTSSTLSSLINVLIHQPEIQQKIFNEIQEVSPGGYAMLSDQSKMPYTQATILEILRYTSVAPFLVPHETTCDTEIGGYSIPKGIQVWCNAWGLHHDEDFWGDPLIFRPERYLDEDGTLLLPDHPKRRHTISFGAGLRVCAGEVFAKSRLFIMTTALVQNFEFLPETTIENQPSHKCTDMTAGLPTFPPVYKARFVTRK